jgi:hypothetical protein
MNVTRFLVHISKLFSRKNVPVKKQYEELLMLNNKEIILKQICSNHGKVYGRHCIIVLTRLF